MGSCCSRPSSPATDLNVHRRTPRRGHGEGSSSRAADEELAAHKSLKGAIATHRLTYQNSSGSTESLTAIPGAVAGSRKGLERERVPNLSSKNTSLQLSVLPGGCVNAAQYISSLPSGHPPPREGCGGEYNLNAPRCRWPGDGGVNNNNASTSHCAGPSFANTTHSINSTSSASSPTQNATGPASPLSSARRGPKQALLSYAEQYRTLQPFLHPRLRNRRWRLVFSSDVHGGHLIDRCQRAFREEGAQWRAFVAARVHHGTSDCNGEEATSMASIDAFGNNYNGVVSSLGSSSNGSVVSASAPAPVLALMETTLVIPAPKNASVSVTKMRNDAPARLDECERAKVKTSKVVDSHVCIGLYLQRCPSLGVVSSYRRSEVLFFLFQSPIQSTSTVEGNGTEPAAPQERLPEQQAPATVSAPPPSVTETGRCRGNVGEDEVPTAATRTVDEETGETHRFSAQSSSSSSLAPTPGREVATPRTQTHRLSNPNDQLQSSTTDCGSKHDGDASNAAGGVANLSLPLPQVAVTSATLEHRCGVNVTDRLVRTVVRHSTVVKERQQDQQTAKNNTETTALAAAETSAAAAGLHVRSVEQPNQIVPPASNGIFSAQWQHYVENILHEQEQQQGQHADCNSNVDCQTHMSPGIAPSPAHGEEDDTYSSISAARGSSGAGVSACLSRHSVTRLPTSAFNELPAALDRNEKFSSLSSVRSPESLSYQHKKNNVPILAAEAGSPIIPCSFPRSTLEPPAPSGDSVFAVTPISAPPAGTLSPTAFELHPLHLFEAGNSLTLEDDVVSSTTTVVSATSVPGGGGLTWREDGDLSIYWPETPYVLKANNSNSNTNNLVGVKGYFHTRSGRRLEEWYSPVNGPQLLPPLSRTSSFGGDDTAECFTSCFSCNNVQSHAVSTTTAFNVPDGVMERQPSSVSSDAQTSSPPPGLTNSAGSAGAAANDSGNSTRGFVPLPPIVALKCGLATRTENELPAFNASATSTATATAAAAPPAIDSTLGQDHAHSAHSATPSVRPVSTHMEVLPMTPWDETHASSSTAVPATPASVNGGGFNNHSELPSRSNSDLAFTEGTLDVYCTFTGAIYMWDPHLERTPKTHATDVSAAAITSGEREFVFQRDASGIHWNVGYFVKHGYFDADGVEQAKRSSPGFPLGDTGYSSLFSYMRAHARKSSGFNTATATTATRADADPDDVLISPLVKMQLCAISSRALPSLFQRSPSGATSAT